LIFIKVNITGGRLFYSRCLESGANEETAGLPHRSFSTEPAGLASCSISA
jgi:hypothetical protein